MSGRACACLALLLAASARADHGAAYGESSRAAALASSVVARPGDTSAIHFNPAGVGDIDRPTLAIYGHAGVLSRWVARTGELGPLERRGVYGWGVSIASPLPGPAWLRRVRLGGAIHVPGDRIIHVLAPVRGDTPSAPFYDDRTQRTSATFALGLDLPWNLRFGVAVSVHPNLVAPTYVTFDPSRGEDVDAGVAIEQGRRLTLDASFALGAQ
ncbi:MAG: hypothetical protein IT378_01255, partial [Sandaracinaceae bacterium]|nr:hypothetical protein [Sandaracinaceae bacterium]